jgi:hypothetical protein
MRLRLPAALLERLLVQLQEHITAQVHAAAHATVREEKGEAPGGETVPKGTGGFLAFHSAPDIELARLEARQKRVGALDPNAEVEIDLDPAPQTLWDKAKSIGGGR